MTNYEALIRAIASEQSAHEDGSATDVEDAICLVECLYEDIEKFGEFATADPSLCLP